MHAIDLDLIWSTEKVVFYPIKHGPIDTESLQFGKKKLMVNGFEGLCEVVLVQIHRSALVHQTGYALFLKEEFGHAGRKLVIFYVL